VAGWELGDAPKCTLLLQPSETANAAAAAAAAPPLAPMSATPACSGGAAAAVNGPHAVRALLGPLDGACVLSGSSDTRLRCWRLPAGEAAKSYTVGGAHPGAPAATFGERPLPSGCRVVYEQRVSDEQRASGGAPEPAAIGAATPAAATARAATAGCVGTDDGGCVAAVTSAAFCAAPHPGLLAAGSLDGTVRIWR